ncbi:pyridoxine 5'-phosphate synthase [Hymenobacter sp. BT770]|uniref:pyridoxine 5'-phosphate synthase n=1 Tax=Hymenobacter sp. BT770 TaxID=2886942 RepID=UPI001D0FC144|nr:pyridoxine 5'-phosphate synthase [Hymenobacter sp. BT770]MCC3154990.1 pyridoxine 5'-phosphate synthase [Hymenobacter sp. BT770]MDO3416992.1 pyridoxine 5'-phosphate synthase [Hymenobacter sp. BT770]
MTKLSVNINKLATLRNARGHNRPDILQAARDIEQFGAEGITVHPRPDERHIRYQDVRDLKAIVTTELNVEGNPTPDFLDLVREVRPEQVTLVPDAPDAITSNAGWDVIKHQDYLQDIVAELKALGCRVSIFLDPDLALVEAAATTGTDRIELYTEAYARQYLTDREQAVAPYRAAAAHAGQLGLGVNAGHDLDLDNLAWLKQQLPELAEVSIGHALVCDAIYLGLENTVQLYKRQLKSVIS